MGHFGELLKTIRPRDLIFFSGYALYLVFSYMTFHSTTVLASSTAIDYDLGVMFSMATMGARVAVYLIGALFARFLKRDSFFVSAFVAATIALVGFLSLAMILHFSSLLPTDMVVPWLLFGGVLLGAGDAVVTLLWARFSATLSLRSVYLFVVLCNAISLAVYFAVTLLPSSTALPVAALLLLLSILFVKKALDVRSGDTVTQYSSPLFRGAIKQLWHPILGTAILCFMSGLMLQISGQQELSLASFQKTSLITSAVAVIALLLPALFIKKPLNIGRIYAVALPLSAAGFLLLPLIWNAAGGIVNAFAQLGAMVAGIILWCMLAESSQASKVPSSLLFSLALLCTNAAQLAGTAVGYANAETLKQGDLVLTTVALVAVYLLLMAALVLFKDKNFKGTRVSDTQDEKPETGLAERCDKIARAHQFTPRETEIFHLLAQGYTMPAISEKLFVSENTIKSHVKSIYQKLDIHVRGELIELVNRP